MLAIHEIAHNLGFGHNKPIADRAFGIIANLPVGQSFSVAFKNYHLEHDMYQDDEVLDTDIATYVVTLSVRSAWCSSNYWFTPHVLYSFGLFH